MLKPDLVRKALVEALPDYGRDPDRLAIFADKGRIATRFAPSGNVNFEWRYTLTVLLLDFTGHPDLPMLALVKWLQVHQLDILQNADRANEAIRFSADVLAGGAIDLQFEMDLTEAVVLEQRDDGGFDMRHLDEPKLMPFSDAFPEDPEPLTSVWLDGEQLLGG